MPIVTRRIRWLGVFTTLASFNPHALSRGTPARPGYYAFRAKRSKLFAELRWVKLQSGRNIAARSANLLQTRPVVGKLRHARQSLISPETSVIMP
jgi:hypothetical protein